MALHAFIDESGQIGGTPKASDHFIMSALVCRDTNLGHLDELLLQIRSELGRQPTDHLAWKKIKRPEQRLRATELIGSATYVRVVSVVVCKRHLTPPISNTHSAYLFTLRFLLERLSWLGRKWGTTTKYTLSHVKHFRAESLETYESKLRAMGTDTEIDWTYLDPYGGRISNDKKVEPLQLADIVASATGRAFEASGGIPADQSFLLALLPRLFRGIAGQNNVLTAYGLKMHPWRDDMKGLYAWVSELQ